MHLKLETYEIKKLVKLSSLVGDDDPILGPC
jgi:hypothetical protein